MKQSISVSKGKGSLSHNNRDFITPNVDKDRTHLNIIYKQEPLKEAYQKLFGEAVEKYNAKQKRKDRMIPDYMQHIKNSKNGEKLFYETIVQVGNKYTCGTLSKDAETAKLILDRYVKNFQERNPNLYVFNAVLHLDELEGTPHVHIDWIPVATGYKNGMEVRNSLDKALKQQGIDGAALKKGNSTQNWQEAEKNVVEKIMNEHGWERAAESGLHLEKRTIGQYKAEMREIENRVQSMPDHISEDKKQAVPFSKDKVIVSKDDLEQLELRARLSIVHEEAAKGLEEKMVTKVDQQIDFNSNHQIYMARQLDLVLREKEYYIKQTNAAARAREAAEQQQIQYQQKYNQQLNLNKENTHLKEKYQDVVKKYNDLLSDSQEQQTFMERQMDKIVDLNSEIASLKDEIKELKKSFEEQIKSLKTAFCEKIRDICKAIGLLKYSNDSHKVQNLTKEQGRLIDAIANYGADIARLENHIDIAKEIDTKVGMSEGIEAEVRALKRQERSYEHER